MDKVRTLGIDIGIASIGWAIIEGEFKNNQILNNEIVASGVRIFSVAENPKDGKSHALPRREARSGRRRNARRRQRILQIKRYLSRVFAIPLNELISENDLPALFKTDKSFLSPWELRSEALGRSLDSREFARVILHIAKRRGYDDITYGIQDDEKGKVKKAIANNQEDLKNKNYQTVGAMMCGEYYTKGASVRNKKEDYNRCVGRSDLRTELKIIFSKQKELGNSLINDDIQKILLGNPESKTKAGREGIIFYQRPLKSFENKIGKCQFFKDKNRACKSSPSAEKFIALTKIINTLATLSKEIGIQWEQQEKKNLISQILQKALQKRSGMNYTDLKNILGLPEDFMFQELDYSLGKKKVEENTLIKSESTIISVLETIFKDMQTKWNKQERRDLIFDILQKASKKEKGISYDQIRSILKLPGDFMFQGLDYSQSNKEVDKDIFIKLKSTYKLMSIDKTLEIKKQDKIAQILSEEKDWERIETKLLGAKFPNSVIEKIKNANLNFSKTINLSLDALYMLIPLMEEGRRYDEAVKELQEKGAFSVIQSEKSKFLPPLLELAKEDSYFDISNPVVMRALSEFRKVMNAIIEKYGSFHLCNIELSRDVGKSFTQRSAAKRRQDENQKLNLEALNIARSYNLDESEKTKLKCKLWLLQGECCIYSGRKITREDLKDETMLDIDHFFPRSRSLDNSQANKVLCFRSENSQKGNKTPYEYLGGDEKRWSDFVGRVSNTKFDKNKKSKLLYKVFKDRKIGERADFLARNLADTGYIARVLSRYLSESLEFLPLDSRQRRIRIVSGSLTSAMRSYWGIPNKSRENHIHHAQDAIIIASINDAAIQRYSEWLKERELGYKNSKEKTQKLSEADYKTKLALRQPMQDFPNQIQKSIEKIFVSHSPSRKVTGALHKETAYGKDEVLIPLEERMAMAKARGGEKYKEGKKSLKFNNAEQRDLAIRLGKIREVNGFLVKNGEMVRVDIFRSKLKQAFYAVPIYTYDVALGKLPNRAIVAGKKDGVIKDWIEMDGNYEFCFSLFKNDYVRIQTEDMGEPVIAIYNSTDSSTASLKFSHHSGFAFASEDEEKFFTDKSKDETTLFSRCGIRNLKVFQKVQASPLGEIKECKPSKRIPISLKSSKKS